MEKKKEKGEEEENIKFLNTVFSSSTDHIFNIKSIENQDGKRVVKIECYVIREKDFVKAKLIQDFLKADKVNFLTVKKFNEDWLNNIENLQRLFGLKEINFEEVKKEKDLIEKVISSFKERLRIL